jgi:hypothetical protein
MAKGKTPKKQFSIEDLMNLYVNYLLNVGNIKSERTAKVYRQQIEYFFSENSSYFGDMSTQEKNFLGLLPKLLCTNKYEGKYSARNKKELHIDRNKKELPASDGLIIINDICKGIDVHFFKKDENKTKTKQNLQSYIRKFFKFIKVVSGQEKIVNKYVKFYSSNEFNQTYSQPKLTPADIAVLSGENGEIYLHSVLFTKFKSRLRCQDRTSGDKIWLPLRFIAKLFNQIDKDHPDKNKFSEWLDSLVNNIYINYRVKDNNKVKVKSVKFMGGDGKDDVHLKIDNGHVYVRWVEGDKLCDFLPVLTSTGRGNQKREMEVNSVSEIAIDHVKAIDCTLRELQFKVLRIVSEKYKEFKEQDIPEEQENAKEKELAQELCNVDKINFGDLIKDLEAIRDDGPLRLMASKYNSQKSNGDTFLKILKRTDGSYFGILEEKIKMANEFSTPDSSDYTLYQDLTDDLNEKGNLLITASTDERMKGTDSGFTLDDIINLV